MSVNSNPNREDIQMKFGNSARLGILISAILCTLPQVAVAGPPLICHPFDIGQAKSLPWSNNKLDLSGLETYDISRLLDDTSAILIPATPVLVRMETIRRATLYALRDRNIARELFMQMKSRAANAIGRNQEDALAQFDFGYLVETYKQARWESTGRGADGATIVAPALSENGYAAIEKAIQLRGDDAQMEFAAALITLGGSSYPDHQQHLQRALDGAATDPLLARNLATHFIGEKTQTMAEMFKKRQAEN